MAWDEDRAKMVAKGWGDEKIQAAASVFAQRLVEQNAAPEEFESYFGKAKEYDPSKLKDYFAKQIKTAMPNHDPVAESDNADTWVNAVKSGIKNSIGGVVYNHGESPSTVTPSSPWYNKVSQGIVQGVLDTPAYIAGGAAGAAGGEAVAGPPGALAGTAMVGMAFPQGLRAGLVQAYKQGGVNSFSDFWNIATESAKEAGKGAITGLATLGSGAIGRAVVKDLGPLATKAVGDAVPKVLSNFAGKALPFAAEVAGMTATGAALDGKMPNLSDFSENAMTLGGLHGLGVVKNKMLNTFQATGMHPADVASEAHTDPVLRQEILSHSEDTPRSFDGLKQASSEHSTHAVVDGHLVPAEQAAKEGEFNFKGTPAQFAEDASQRFALAKQYEAAKAHDKEGFRQLEELHKEFQAAKGDENTPPNKEALQQIKARYKDLAPRLTDAWERAHTTLTENLKDRVVNSQLSLPSAPYSQVFDHLNPDFNNPADHVPELNDDVKHALASDDHAIEELKGDGADVTGKDILHYALKDKPELAYAVAPDLVNTDPETGAKTVKPIDIRAGQKRQTKVPFGFALEKAMWNKINSLDEVYRKSADENIRNMPITDRASSSVLHAQESFKRAMGFIKDGVYNQAGKKTSQSLNEIYDTLPKDKIHEAEQYVLYKQVLADAARGMQTQVDPEVARKFVVENRFHYEDFSKKLTALNNAVLDWTVERKALKSETAKKWKDEFKDYVPGYRVNEDSTTKSAAGVTRDGTPFKTREGSELPYMRPYEAMMTKFANVSRFVEMNDAKREVLKLNEMLPKDEKILHTVAEGETDMDHTFSRQVDENRKLGRNQVGFVDEKGNYSVMNFKDPELAKYLRAPEPDPDSIRSFKWLMQPFKWAAGLTRTGASLSSTFTVAHIIRAEGFSWFVSDRMGRVPFLDTMKALPDVLKNTEVSKEAHRAGAYDGMITPLDETNEAMNKYMTDDKYGSYSATHNTIKSIWGMNHEIINQWTKAQRLSEYKALRAESPNASFSELQTMGAQARRVTVDAMRTGAAMSFLSSYIPFYQYEVQGAVRGFEAMKENPGKSAVKLAAVASLAALAWAAGRGHDEIEEQSPEIKRNYWLIPAAGIGDGILRIPKPWGPEKAICALVEQTMSRVVDKDPHGMDDFFGAILDTLPLPKLPAALDAGLIMHNNFNTYTGRSYMSDHMMKLAPEDRAMPYTSESARLIAKGLGNLQGLPVIGKLVGDQGLHLTSPQIVDYAIRQFGGTQAQMVTRGADALLAAGGVKPPVEAPSWKDDPSQLPYVGALIARNPSYNSKSYNDFRSEFQKSSEIFQSYKERLKSNDPESAEIFASQHPEVNFYAEMRSAYKAVQTMVKEIHQIDNDDSLSPSDKKQLTDDHWKSVIATAKQTLDNLENVRGETK